MNNSIVDAFFKKKVTFKYKEVQVTFNVSQSLFSSTHIDLGTQRLLRSLDHEERTSFTKILDLGCGYGPIGLTLKVLNPNAEVHLVDRDALALLFSKENASLNDLFDLRVYGSTGYDQVEIADFDLIISNIPAKVSPEVLKHMLTDAVFHLRKGGMVAVVVIDAIHEPVAEILHQDYIKIHYHNHWPGHHVYHYSFEEPFKQEHKQDSFIDEIYTRNRGKFIFDTTEFDFTTSYHLPEFEQLSILTELFLDSLAKLQKEIGNNRIAILNPGQGYVALGAAALYPGATIEIYDSNLQALKMTEHNLEKNRLAKDRANYHHQVLLGEHQQDQSALFLGLIPEKQNLEVYHLLIDQVAASLREEGLALLGSSSTVITRVQKYIKKVKGFDILSRTKNKGMSVLLLRKTSIVS